MCRRYILNVSDIFSEFVDAAHFRVHPGGYFVPNALDIRIVNHHFTALSIYFDFLSYLFLQHALQTPQYDIDHLAKFSACLIAVLLQVLLRPTIKVLAYFA